MHCSSARYGGICRIPSVSSEELALNRLVRCEPSRFRCHGHSLLLSSYLCRIKRKENSSCNTCGHTLQDLAHLQLDYPVSEPLRSTIFGTTVELCFITCGVSRLLGLLRVPPRPHPSEGVG